MDFADIKIPDDVEDLVALGVPDARPQQIEDVLRHVGAVEECRVLARERRLRRSSDSRTGVKGRSRR